MSLPAPHTLTWYLLKQVDGNIFGPATFEQLRQWAAEAQVSPLDRISTDQTHWVRAPMLPELGMDWLVEVTHDYCYGPTTLGTVGDFLRRGEIGPETVLLNACDGSSRRVADVPELAALPEAQGEPPAQGSGAEGDGADGREGMPGSGGFDETLASDRTARRFSLQQRIRELESDLREERRLLTSLNDRYTELEAKYIQLLGHQRAARAVEPEGPPRLVRLDAPG